MSRRAESSETRIDPREFRRSLQRWFRQSGRDLPWRRTRDPYAIFVSELMLQQTQVATVLPYYERWLKRFPDFTALANASESDVLHAWQGLGYYARARNLHVAGKFVEENCGGQMPVETARIAQLPGVGRYTAGAVASFAFDRSEPIVEANIARVVARLTNWTQPIDAAAGRDHLWSTAQSLLPAKNARDHNLALMDLGAMICLPRRPLCDACPVQRFCQAVEPELLPRKKQRRATVYLTEHHGFTRERNRVLLEQSHDRWRGMWMLPRLKTTSRRRPLVKLVFPFTHHRVTLAVSAQPAPKIPTANQQWFPLPALERLPLPSPHRRALIQLLPAEKDLAKL
jgi:A/G-specific adenine glycosylase